MNNPVTRKYKQIYISEPTSPLARIFACRECEAVRLYEGHDASRPSMSEATLACDYCEKETRHKRQMNGFPRLSGERSKDWIPTGITDDKEYEGYQREAFAIAKEKTHPDNYGREYRGTDHLVNK